MYAFDELLEKIDFEIEHLTLDREPRLLYEPIRYILESGGKRTRPVFVLLGCNMFDDRIDQAMDTALAVELFHNFTLLHDDIMDRAEKRRGRNTVHKRWNDNIAILSGDAMMILAYRLLTRRGGNHLQRLLEIFNRFSLEVCEGQQYDMDFEAVENVSEKEYLRMIELKTSVLFAGALQMGAIIGGASSENAGLLYDAGLNLGLAFQLQDDLLDTFGDPVTFGKNIGGDIVANKKTFLLVNALNLAQGTDKEQLHSLLAADGLPERQKIDRVKSIYERTGVRELARKRIAGYFDTALKILEKVDIETYRKKPLTDMACWLMEREK